MRRNALIALCTGMAALALAASAFAASGAAANADCEKHSQLTASYTNAELQNALATMPVNEQEYTNCLQTIQAQLLKQSGTGHPSSGGSSSSGGSFLPTPVIVILVLLALAAATFGALAVRRRRDD